MRSPRRHLQGHQVRLRQPQRPRKRQRPRRGRTSGACSTSSRSAIPFSSRWIASRTSAGELVIVTELADHNLHEVLQTHRCSGQARHSARRVARLPARSGRGLRPLEPQVRPAASRHQAAQPVPRQQSRQGRRLRPGQHAWPAPATAKLRARTPSRRFTPLPSCFWEA